ncbi:MAG: hypothetical protein J6866_02475, partial [Victivallales bacterium]|nr:hypothetical protein [Victivallales bacterium]
MINLFGGDFAVINCISPNKKRKTMNNERKWSGIWIKAYGVACHFVQMPPAPYYRTTFEVGAKP